MEILKLPPIRETVSLAASIFLSITMIVAPSFANILLVDRPIPLPAPVTIANLPAKAIIICLKVGKIWKTYDYKFSRFLS